MSKQHIEDCVRESLQDYFHDLGGESPDGVYAMVLRLHLHLHLHPEVDAIIPA